MTNARVSYADSGITTRQGLFWTVSLLAVMALTVVIFRGVANEFSYRLVGLQLVWAVAVFLHIVRILRRLKQLEKDGEEPDAGMKLAFESASMFMIVGYLPIVIDL